MLQPFTFGMPYDLIGNFSGSKLSSSLLLSDVLRGFCSCFKCFKWLGYFYTVDIRYLEYTLWRTYVISNFFFSTLGNCYHKFIGYLKPHHLELLPYRTIFSVPSVLFLGPFSICYPERFHFNHSNVERIHSKTLTGCLSFLISTQKHVDQVKVH